MHKVSSPKDRALLFWEPRTTRPKLTYDLNVQKFYALRVLLRLHLVKIKSKKKKLNVHDKYMFRDMIKILVNISKICLISYILLV